MNIELSQKVAADPPDSAFSTNDHHMVTNG